MNNRIDEHRKWPDRITLKAWYLFRGLDNGSDYTPEDYLGLIEQFESFNLSNLVTLHEELYEEYKEFRAKYLPADY